MLDWFFLILRFNVSSVKWAICTFHDFKSSLPTLIPCALAHIHHNLLDGLDRSGLAQNHLAVKCLALGGTVCLFVFCFEGQLCLNINDLIKGAVNATSWRYDDVKEKELPESSNQWEMNGNCLPEAEGATKCLSQWLGYFEEQQVLGEAANCGLP